MCVISGNKQLIGLVLPLECCIYSLIFDVKIRSSRLIFINFHQFVPILLAIDLCATQSFRKVNHNLGLNQPN